MRIFFVFLCFLFNYQTNGQYFDTLMVHFDINSTNISPAYKDSIQTFIAKQQHDQPKYLVYGLADYLGSDNQNLILSKRRAQVVAEFLLSNNIKRNDILVIDGLGRSLEQSAENEVGNKAKRNAMILVPKRRNVITPIANEITSEKTPTIKSIKALIQETNVNETFVLGPINFTSSTADILPISMPKLTELVSVMREHPNLKISIEGHICCNQLEGSDPSSASFKLSIYRAKKIYDYLIAHKINAERLSYTGYGRSRPIHHEEDTEDKQAENRRVEIRIVAK